MKIHQIPAGFSKGMNNLIWVIQQDNSPQCILIDPGYAEPVCQFIADNNLQPVAILITHHHYDHTDGVQAVIERYGELPIYGYHDSPFKPTNQPLEDQQTFTIESLNIEFSALHTPGHTLDHLTFYCPQHNIAFVGDLVFAAGAGAVFEGTAKNLQDSIDIIRQLPITTQLYCGHDFSISNYQFAIQVEPSNELLSHCLKQAKHNYKQKNYTGSTNVSNEQQTNPFWRADKLEIKENCERLLGKSLQNELDVFTAIRKLR